MSTTVIIIIIIAEMAVFNAAGYLIEERRRLPVITHVAKLRIFIWLLKQLIAALTNEDDVICVLSHVGPS